LQVLSTQYRIVSYRIETVGFHPTQRTQRIERKERNAMTSLLDGPTAGGNGQSQPITPQHSDIAI